MRRFFHEQRLIHDQRRKSHASATMIQRNWRGYWARLKYAPAPENPCVICCEEIHTRTEATLNGCSHKFCFECIKMWAEQTENSCPQCRQKFNIISSIEQTTTVEDKEQSIPEELSLSLAMELQLGEWGSDIFLTNSSHSPNFIYRTSGWVELLDTLRQRDQNPWRFWGGIPDPWRDREPVIMIDESSFDFLGWLQDFEANVEVYDNQGYTFESVFSPLADFDLAIWFQRYYYYLNPERNENPKNVGKKDIKLHTLALPRAYVYCGSRPLNRQPYMNFRRPKFRKC